MENVIPSNVPLSQVEPSHEKPSQAGVAAPIAPPATPILPAGIAPVVPPMGLEEAEMDVLAREGENISKFTPMMTFEKRGVFESSKAPLVSASSNKALLEDMSRSELQAVAKEKGIKGNLSTEKLKAALLQAQETGIVLEENKIRDSLVSPKEKKRLHEETTALEEQHSQKSDNSFDGGSQSKKRPKSNKTPGKSQQ